MQHLDRRILWLIAILMFLSVGVLTCLQAYWIVHAYNENNTRFKKGVSDALYDAAQTIEEEERARVNDLVSLKMPQANLAAPNAKGMIGGLQRADGQTFGQGLTIKYSESEQTSFVAATKQAETFRKQLRVGSLASLPLVQRIDAAHVEEIVQEELIRQGISLDYLFGIYDRKEKTFLNFYGQDACETLENLPKEQLREKLINSGYSALLFERDIDPPGMLFLHFPGKKNYVLQTVLLNILITIFCILIVVGCFTYVLSTIFKQKKVSEMKTDFINNMTHEFKTPIATISLAADFIQNPSVISDETKVKKFITMIKEENTRMNKQVEKVLQLASLDKEDFKLKIEPCDVHDIIQNAAAHMGLQIRQRGGTITTYLKATQYEIEADQVHLNNVIHNLLDNANKYSPEAPDVTISTENKAGALLISVQDKGLGMTPDVRKRVFDRFYREHTGNRHDVKGFGLGLSYVKSIIDALGGTADVKSEKGKGSTFILQLPLKQMQS